MKESFNKIKKHETIPETVSVYEQCIGCTIKDLSNDIKILLEKTVKNKVVSFRIKDPETLQKKIQLKNVKSIFSIDDVYGIRIIVESVDDVYKVLEKIWQTFPGYLDHDYIKEPMVRPDESKEGKKLQLLQFIAYKNEMPFEIQITTTAFNEINETLHEGYHNRKYNS
ncbi:MAG: hypothetical protein KGL67_00350 [Patescibacteria group bacterium]|nr:hypothetical protein [Patescibacteria group bacterium]